MYQFVAFWVAVYGGALVLLAVMSFVSAKFILDGLEVLDRRLNRVERRGDGRNENEQRV